MFVVNNEGRRQTEEEGDDGMEQGVKEEERKQGSRREGNVYEEVNVQHSHLNLSLSKTKYSVVCSPATPPPHSLDSFSHNSPDPRPGQRDNHQRVGDNYYF